MNRAMMSIAVFVSFLLHGVCINAAGPKISDLTSGGNKHNLSSLNTNVTYKADPSDPRGTEICVFCHTPHKAGRVPLWNRKDPTVSFGRYSSATLVIRNTPIAQYGEPNGASRLCLSCHDGVTAGGVSLGDVLNSGGIPINMGINDKISGLALFDANKIRTGHHPISFIYDDAVLGTIRNDPLKATQEYKLPTLPEVKLDGGRRMQCTTCHNPHQNQSTEETYVIPPNVGRKIAPFWVYGREGNATSDRDVVCLNCHNLSIVPFP